MKKNKEKNVKVIPNLDISNKYYHKDPRNLIETFVLNLVPDILSAYGIGNTTIFVQTIKDDGGCYETESGSMLFTINYVKEYKTAYLNIMPKAQVIFGEREYDIIAGAVIHEIGHIVTGNLGKLALDRFASEKSIRDAVEETTESIAQIVRGVLAQTKPEKFTRFNKIK